MRSYFKMASKIINICYYSTIKSLNYLHNVQPINTTVKVQGWIKRLKKHKQILFMDLVDGLSNDKLQILAEPTQKTEKLTLGSVVTIEGELMQSSHPKQKIELKANKIEILGTFDTQEFPFDNKVKHDFSHLREHLHLRCRTEPFKSIFKIRNELFINLHTYFQQKGFYLIQTPILTSNNCEGGGEIFKIQGPKQEDKNDDFFSNDVYLTVSGQLQLETFVCGGLAKVYNITPAFRAENTNTKRHLSEFYMLEAEIAFTNTLNDLIQLIEDLIKWTTQQILIKCKDDIDYLSKYEGIDRHLVKLSEILNTDFKICTYTEAVNLINKNLHKFATPLQWGMRLQKEHENFIVEKFDSKPVFVTDFPAYDAPFYMKSNRDEAQTVAAVDLLVPVVGELCGGSLREDNLQLLNDKYKSMNVSEELNWYLELRKYATLPHGGFGMGIERYLQFVTGISNIKDTIPFPRWPHNCQM